MPQSARESTHLTPREVAVMHLVAKGLRNKEIGEQLLIGEGTVKIHLNRIYAKLKLKGRLALALYVRYRDML
jgi:DNA-binding NarL/FixJ family response regulator